MRRNGQTKKLELSHTYTVVYPTLHILLTISTSTLANWNTLYPARLLLAGMYVRICLLMYVKRRGFRLGSAAPYQSSGKMAHSPHLNPPRPSSPIRTWDISLHPVRPCLLPLSSLVIVSLSSVVHPLGMHRRPLSTYTDNSRPITKD